MARKEFDKAAAEKLGWAFASDMIAEKYVAAFLGQEARRVAEQAESLEQLLEKIKAAEEHYAARGVS